MKHEDQGPNQFCGRTRREFLWESGAGFTGLAMAGMRKEQAFDVVYLKTGSVQNGILIEETTTSVTIDVLVHGAAKRVDFVTNAAQALIQIDTGLFCFFAKIGAFRNLDFLVFLDKLDDRHRDSFSKA